MDIKYVEGSDLNEFFLSLENAMKAASDATESVMTEGQKSIYLFHSMPKSWKNDLRIWKGQRKYIPYEDLKESIEGKVRNIEAQERYTLVKGTPEKNERALMATRPSVERGQDRSRADMYSYCDRPRHNIRQCRGLQKDLRDGRVKAGTVLPANFAFKANSKRDHPYRTNTNGNMVANPTGKKTTAETTTAVASTSSPIMRRTVTATIATTRHLSLTTMLTMTATASKSVKAGVM
ncbi:unnamed protein product [Phytophthora lilii]|uniref:Unnamed protein product n=1 Tax=Phytophthora lilii TaxID=2077276 RepID=A0A9W6TPV5_9STRA|nr:unnamed protein product [Phytophthora lilii]